jgi:uncharacterized protein YbbC (DUF1343 family)
VRRTCFLFVGLLCCLAIAQDARGQAVLPGIDVLRNRSFDVLQGKRVGLITNPTGVTASLEQSIDVLYAAPGVRLVALFGPEHGVRGDVEAGKYVESYNDPRTGLPVYSLYGRTRKPTSDMLRGLDVLVYDIQDIGVRSYTYISTMGYAMEAAAENGVEFIVLDRPNPLTGVRVEGPMLDLAYKSFVGMYPIPYVYGMTVGELAHMLNEEGWLNGGARCNLRVIPMDGWLRTMWWEDTGLEWVPPSPNIPRSTTPMFYVMTGLLGELGTVNQGVGFTLPFELVGAPWIDAPLLARNLNTRGLKGVYFRPTYYRPYYVEQNNLQYRYSGVQIHVVDRDNVSLTAVMLSVLDALYRLFPDRNIFERSRMEKVEMFDKVLGSNHVRRMLVTYTRTDDILRHIDQQIPAFLKARQKYLMYE